MTKEELKKSVDELVNKAFEENDKTVEAKSEDNIEKAVDKDTERPSNGGKDKFKSGSPETEKQAMKKAEDEKKAKEAAEAVEKGCDEKEEAKDMSLKKKKNMYKAFDEDFDLDDEEVELLKAWRAEKSNDSDPVVPALDESTITKSITAALEPIQKSIEDKDDLIKGLQDKIEKMANQPAYDKRSLDSLETIEKGGDKPVETISKSQTLDRMLDLQQQGKGITSVHIAEFEATNNIGNPQVKQLVMDSFKN